MHLDYTSRDVKFENIRRKKFLKEVCESCKSSNARYYINLIEYVYNTPHFRDQKASVLS